MLKHVETSRQEGFHWDQYPKAVLKQLRNKNDESCEWNSVVNWRQSTSRYRGDTPRHILWIIEAPAWEVSMFLLGRRDKP